MFLKKPMTEASARLQLLPTKSPCVAAALSSGRNWKHSSTPAFGPVTGFQSELGQWDLGF